MKFLLKWLFNPDWFTLHFGGGGGGGTTQSTGTTYTTNIPEYARPYVETMLGATQKQLFEGTPTEGGGFDITGFKPYKPYSESASDYVAPFSPMQEKAFQGINQLAPSRLGQSAGNLAGAATLGALGTNYDPYKTGQFTSEAAGQYMNPFLEQAMAPQLREAQRASEIMGTQQAAEATRSGAFGGSRQAIVEAERQRNLGIQQGDIRARGYQAAFDQAQQQFEREQARQEQSRQFGSTLGMQGLQTALQGAGLMGTIGGQQFGQQKDIIGLQSGAGAQQQSQEQQKINQSIMDYANAQQYPLMLLGTMSNMLRGLPMQAATTNQYVAAPNPITQGIGAAGAGASIYNAMKPSGAAGGLPSEFKYASGGIASVPRYDVGGEVESDLESMKTEELAKQAKESSSPIIRRMAQRILRERQMEQGPGQMPQMAGGGIVAFQDGGLNDLQRRLAAATQSGDFESANFYAKQVADAKAPARSGITQMSPAAIERLKQDPYAEGKTAPGMPDESQMGGSLATSAAPRPAPTPRRDVVAPRAAPPAAVPAAPAAEPDRSAGIMAVAPPDRAGEAEAQAALAAGVKPVEATPSFTGPNADIRKAVYEAQRVADRPESEFLREVQAGKPENTAAAEYRKQIMAERANSKEENERQRYMRAAQFFAKWGSTPGPTLAAGLSALEKSLPDIIADEQGYKKAKRELDKIQFDIDNATRLEELGDRKEARALKVKAADRAFQLNERLAQSMSAENVARIGKEGTIRAAEIHAEASRAGRAESAAQRRQAADTAAEAKTYSQYQAAGRQRDVVERDIAREKEGKQYTTDLKFLQTYGNMDLKDLPKGYDKKIEEVKQRVATTEKGWETRLNRARLGEENAYKRLMGEDAGPTTTAPPPAAGKTVTMDDVIATAKATGKPIEQVRKDAIAKGFTVK